MLFVNNSGQRVGVRLARKNYEADPGETIEIPDRYAYAIKLQGIPLDPATEAPALVAPVPEPEVPVTDEAPQAEPTDTEGTTEDGAQTKDESTDEPTEPATADGPKLTKAQRWAAKAAAAAAAVAK